MAILKPTTYASSVQSASLGNTPDGDALALLFQHSQLDRSEAPHVSDLWKGLPPADHNLDNVRLSLLVSGMKGDLISGAFSRDRPTSPRMGSSTSRGIAWQSITRSSLLP